MKQKKNKEEEELKFVKEGLERCTAIMKEQDKEFDQDKWFYYHFIPTIKSLRDFYRKKKYNKEAKQMTKYIRAFKILERLEKKDNAFLSIWLDDKTRVKSKRETGMGRLIEEKTDLKKWKKEECRIVDGLDGITSINFCGLSLEIPTKKVKYLEENKK